MFVLFDFLFLFTVYNEYLNAPYEWGKNYVIQAMK